MLTALGNVHRRKVLSTIGPATVACLSHSVTYLHCYFSLLFIPIPVNFMLCFMSNVIFHMYKVAVCQPLFSPLGMLAEKAIYFTSSLSLQLVYLRRC